MSNSIVSPEQAILIAQNCVYNAFRHPMSALTKRGLSLRKGNIKSAIEALHICRDPRAEILIELLKMALDSDAKLMMLAQLKSEVKKCSKILRSNGN